MSIAPAVPDLRRTVSNCIRALRGVANYSLPAALNRRLLELGEHKETLSATEQEHLLALVEFTHDRTIEKLQAEVALKDLQALFPDEAT